MRHYTAKVSVLCLTVSSAFALAHQALAADPAVPIEKRVDRLEKEVRAVQRKVFPGGAPVEPDITVAEPSAAAPPPASTPVTDLLARVTALESQLATLTGQVEQNSYRLKQLEQKFEEMKTQTPPPVTSTVQAPVSAQAAVAPPSTPVSKPAAAIPSSKSLPAKTTAAPSASADEARKAAVAAIEKPATGDAANDSYTYGFRLWNAKFYPEAEEQLKATLDKFGSSSIASRTQNLLGRAYYDDGKVTLAAKTLYENYRLRPTGDRAAESLVWLGESLIQMKRLKDACLAYESLADEYGTNLSAAQKSMMEKGRARAKCGQ
jgi:TolA-binding protein